MATAAWRFDLADATRVVLGFGLGGPTRVAVDHPLSDDAWRDLRGEVDVHRLHGLLVAAVAGGALVASDAQQVEVAQLEVELTRSRMWQEQRFAAVLADLAAEGIDALLLKGLALATLDYPDAQWRPTADLDLLVHGSDLDRARQVLGRDGAVQRDLDPTPGYGATIGKGGGVTTADGLEVDLHRVLVSGAFGVRIRPDDLWSAPRDLVLGDRPIRTMSLEATLLHACYHLLILGYQRALTVRDVGQLAVAPGLDAERTLWLARRWDADVVLATALVMARDELGLGDDQVLLQWAGGFAPTIRSRARLRIERPGEHVSAVMSLSEYLALRTPDERAVYRRATLHPAPGTWPPLRARAGRMGRRFVGNAEAMARRAGGIARGANGRSASRRSG